jgi:hypothetical protein
VSYVYLTRYVLTRNQHLKRYGSMTVEPHGHDVFVTTLDVAADRASDDFAEGI